MNEKEYVKAYCATKQCALWWMFRNTALDCMHVNV